MQLSSKEFNKFYEKEAKQVAFIILEALEKNHINFSIAIDVCLFILIEILEHFDCPREVLRDLFYDLKSIIRKYDINNQNKLNSFETFIVIEEVKRMISFLEKSNPSTLYKYYIDLKVSVCAILEILNKLNCPYEITESFYNHFLSVLKNHTSLHD